MYSFRYAADKTKGLLVNLTYYVGGNDLINSLHRGEYLVLAQVFHLPAGARPEHPLANRYRPLFQHLHTARGGTCPCGHRETGEGTGLNFKKVFMGW